MAMIYKLVGFDRATEEPEITQDIPRDKISRAKRIAGIANKPAIFADWPISHDQSRAITNLIGVEFDVHRFDWALEPYPASNGTQRD
jgi:hypothetical protein